MGSTAGPFQRVTATSARDRGDSGAMPRSHGRSTTRSTCHGAMVPWCREFVLISGSEIWWHPEIWVGFLMLKSESGRWDSENIWRLLGFHVTRFFWWTNQIRDLMAIYPNIMGVFQGVYCKWLKLVKLASWWRIKLIKPTISGFFFSGEIKVI